MYGDIPYTLVNEKGEIMTALAEKTYRMDIRLTQPQRMSYEKAASFRGQTLSQWVTSHLDESARQDINAAAITLLSSEAFDTFCQMLEEPMPQAAQELLSRKAVWDE